MTTPVVEIHVRGGLAYVVRKDAGVRVVIRDFDNYPKGDHPEEVAAQEVIRSGAARNRR